MYQYNKHFTIDEARSHISRLKYQISEITKLKEYLDQIGFDIHTRRYQPGYNPDTLTEFPDEYIQLSDIIQTLLEDGIIIKGIEKGLVDFPSLRDNGEEVFLCWKESENDISFWHSLTSGYRGRRPIEEF
ncbi:DUF2203 domain-containing protein [Calditrichota bacterium]